MKTELSSLVQIFCKHFVSSKVTGFTEIAVGEALTELYVRESEIGAEFSLPARKAYLYKTAKNKILNEVRRQKKLKHINDGSIDIEKVPELADSKFELTEIEKIYIADVLNLLTEKRREVMELKYIEGYTAKQIAEKLGKSIYTVKELLAEAKNDLRKKLRNEEK